MRDHSITVDPSLPRPSACPGLLRIVQALDGGICRVKLAGGVLSSNQARAIAEAAEHCASGVQALLDTRPLAAALLELLQNTPALHGLSAKFAIQLDGREALTMLEHPHDIWLSALPGASTQLAFGLAGCPTDTPLGAIGVEQAAELIEQLLLLFLDLAGSEHSRMRQLLGVIANRRYTIARPGRSG